MTNGGAGAGVRFDPEPLPVTQHEQAPPAPGLPNVVTAVTGLAVAVGLSLLLEVLVDRMDDQPSDAVLIVLSSLVFSAGLLGALLVVSRRRGAGSIVRDFGFRFRWSDLGFGLAGAIVGRVVAGMSLLPIIFLDDDFADRSDRQLFGGDAVDGWTWAAAIFAICVAAPLIEELFFRGMLQNRLVDRLGVVRGIALTSLLFGAAHLVGWEGYSTFVQAWGAAFGGLVLGVTYHYAKRLGASVIAHSLFNAVVLVVLWATTRS